MGTRRAAWRPARRLVVGLTNDSARLQELGITPIVTLLHHGSGPADTDLLDSAFPSKLAALCPRRGSAVSMAALFHAGERALDDCAFFSPIRSLVSSSCAIHRAFVSRCLNQVEGIARAMDAIREEIPAAALVHTEDLGKTTPPHHLPIKRSLKMRGAGAAPICSAVTFNRTGLCAHGCELLA